MYYQGFYLPSGLGTDKEEFIKAANALKKVLIELKNIFKNTILTLMNTKNKKYDKKALLVQPYPNVYNIQLQES